MAEPRDPDYDEDMHSSPADTRNIWIRKTSALNNGKGVRHVDMRPTKKARPTNKQEEEDFWCLGFPDSAQVPKPKKPISENEIPTHDKSGKPLSEEERRTAKIRMAMFGTEKKRKKTKINEFCLFIMR